MALTKISGSVIKDSISLSGNVSVGGTLTYQDVTNVDALGVGTFRAGVNVSGGQIDVGSNIKIGNAGVITATSYRGDGSQLTGISVDSTKIETGNTKVETIDTGSDGHIKFTTEGSERARILANGNIGIGEDAPVAKVHIAGSNYVSVGGGGFDSNTILALTRNFTVGQSAGLALNSGTSATSFIHLGDADDPDIGKITYDHTNNSMSFTSNATERVRIDGSGRMGIGDNSPDRELVVKNASSNSTIKIEASNAHTSQLFFSDTDAENVARIGVFHGSGQSTSNAMLFETGGTARMMINSSGQLIVNTVTSTDAIFTVSSPNHYVVTSSGKAHKHIHCRSVNGNSGEYGGAISFGMGSDGSSAIAAEQMGSSGNVNGLAFFTHETSTGSDDSSKKMRINNTGGIMLNNWENNRGFIFQRLGAGTFPDLANVQGSQGRGMIDAQKTINQNTTTDLCASHWGGLALVGYSGSGHQGVRHVMFGYGGAGVSVRFSGNWVGSLTTTFSMSGYTLRVSHNASNALDFWVILIGI